MIGVDLATGLGRGGLDRSTPSAASSGRDEARPASHRHSGRSGAAPRARFRPARYRAARPEAHRLGASSTSKKSPWNDTSGSRSRRRRTSSDSSNTAPRWPFGTGKAARSAGRAGESPKTGSTRLGASRASDASCLATRIGERPGQHGDAGADLQLLRAGQRVGHPDERDPRAASTPAPTARASRSPLLQLIDLAAKPAGRRWWRASRRERTFRTSTRPR